MKTSPNSTERKNVTARTRLKLHAEDNQGGTDSELLLPQNKTVYREAGLPNTAKYKCNCKKKKVNIITVMNYFEAHYLNNSNEAFIREYLLT